MTEEVAFGTLHFYGDRLLTPTYDQPLQGLRTGLEIDRLAQQGMTKIKFGDFSGGLARYAGIGSWTRDLNLLWRNEGLQTRIPGMMILPEVVTNQSAVTAYNISALVAANKRLHAFTTSLADTGLRWLCGLGTRVLGDTSVSNPALVSRATFTDNICSAGLFGVNSLIYAAFGTDGATNDVCGTVDVTGSGAPSFTTLIALSAGDSVWAFQHLPTIGQGYTAVLGKIGGITRLWYVKASDTLPATAKEVVLAATKDVFSASATPIAYGPLYAGEAIGSSAWTTLQNSTSQFGTDTTPDDANYAVFDAGSAHVVTDTTWRDFNFRAAGVADNMLVTGLIWKVECFESNADDNIFFSLTSIVTEDDRVDVGIGAGRSRHLQNPLEIAVTTPTVYTFGGATDKDTLTLTGADVNKTEFGVYIEFDHNGTTSVLSVDYVTLEVRAVSPGTPLGAGSGIAGGGVTLGGWKVSENPAFPERMAYVAPAADELTTILQPRSLWFYDFEYDGTADRPVVTPSKPNTGMAYVHHAAPFQGGYVVTGGNIAGPGKFLKHIDSQGQLRDFAFPGVHGSTAVSINSIQVQGSWLILDVVNDDFTDRQWWLWNNGKFYAETLLQSLTQSLAITAQPIPYAEATLSLQQSQIYTIFPSSTNTAAARQFIPVDLGQDPRLVNTSQVKSMAFAAGTENLAVNAQTVELDILPEEANKTLVAIAYHGRQISAASGAAYGSVTVSGNVAGDHGFSATAFTKEFTSAYENYNVPTSGVSYDTMIFKYGLKHDTASADTPNGLSVLATVVPQWTDLLRYDFLVDAASLEPDYFTWLDTMQTLQASKNVQALKAGSLNVNAAFEGISFPRLGIIVPAMGSPPGPMAFTEEDRKGESQKIPLILHFRQSPGTVA